MVIMRLRAPAVVLGLVVLLAGAGAAWAQTPIVAARVAGSGPIPDPLAAVWKDARPVTVAMLPQTVTVPHKVDIAVKELTVRAVHNGGWLAFLIEWTDPTLSDKIILDNFGDQVAVQLPVDTKGPVPSPMMGNPGGRVNIMQWRAAFQADIDHGPRTIKDLYPYAWADVYPDEVLTATDARPYAGALGIENPISRGVASPVLDQMAEGWGSMTVKPDQAALGQGVWKDGVWRVAITRPMVSDDLNAPRLLPGDQTVVSFAVWEGGNREVGGRKAWGPWVPLVIGKAAASPSAPRPKAAPAPAPKARP
jgi:DMSO reductase family type II enzyme heme b subunit